MRNRPEKEEICRIAGEAKQLFSKAAQVPVVTDPARFKNAVEACERFANRISGDHLKMAVVGTIKSGKSTVINSLFCGDYLRRGAGVITSIVTRIRRSDRLAAKLYLKTAEEINAEITGIVRKIPIPGKEQLEKDFDIRNKDKRISLAKSLESLGSEHFMEKDMRNPGLFLLRSYLAGYSRVERFMNQDSSLLVFDSEKFFSHKEFSGDEILAVFVKDILLEVNSGLIEPGIEVADCQGSDSPNPLHMTMIQDYLGEADLVVYIISSRTGIRRADLDFLSMIKQMGIIGQCMFVMNFDFDEHNDVSDLERVKKVVAADLAMIAGDPDIYTFSALYSLFCSMEKSLEQRDASRLSQWRTATELAGLSESEMERFVKDFRNMITRHRYALMVRSHASRIRSHIADLLRLVRLDAEALRADSKRTDEIARTIEKRLSSIKKSEKTIRSAMEGACSQMKREIRKVTDRFFDNKRGEPLPRVLDYVRNYDIDLRDYAKELDGNFSGVLLALFERFQNDLDGYMAKEINPLIFRFVKETEDYIKESVGAVFSPYDHAAGDLLRDLLSGSNGNAPGPVPGDWHIDFEGIKKEKGLELPSSKTILDYSAGIRTEAFMKLGWYKVFSRIRSWLGKDPKDADLGLRALQGAVSRIKKETETAIYFHFKNFRENLKFQYFFKLIDYAAETAFEIVTQRYESIEKDVRSIIENLGQQKSTRKDIMEKISELEAMAHELLGRIDSLIEAYS